ncbi:oligosaccharide flippase family protein [Falsibacillus albus]|uniref:Multidrug transporter MatE n=1 Tax=Falsibacillus albus TaxID=2478915 RepID=A0A3L7JSQ1_9BACI|nr:oligosaccharide flippase family protein [Falsibacillus albus]RLQ93079.1 multidrug transporter MatE [Falsibacillus albus]
MNTFLKGSILLITVAFLGECLEFLINMVLAKEIGAKGMGMYMSILPFVFLVVVIASLELPISLSKLVAEKEERYHRSLLHHAFKMAVYSTVVFLVVATFVFPSIPIFQHYPPILRGLMIALIPVISISSIARGYFMGVQQMGKIAMSNFLRKVLQLLFLVMLYQLFDFQPQIALLVAICTLIGCEIVVLIYLILAYVFQFRELKHKSHDQIRGKVVRKSLLAVSVPTTGLRIFHAITAAIQPFLIKTALMHSGLSESMSTEQFGILAGVAFTIGFFPAFISHSLLIILIPTVSEHFANHNHKDLQNLLQKVMVFTFVYGVPAVCLFYFGGEKLTTLFFHSTDAVYYLQLLWPFFLLHYFIIPMQAFLIGLGLVKDAFLHSILSTAVAFLGIYILGGMMGHGMVGIILGMNTGAMLLTLLHYLTICKRINISIFMKPQPRIFYKR